ncbi:MAG TPA: multicopper oxidase family protein [Gemmatimonadaceae bacterium]
MSAVAVSGQFALSAQPVRFSAECSPATPLFSSPYCAELVAVPDLPGARGVMQLTPVVSPFGIAVDSAGRQRVRLTLVVQGLPGAASLGAYRTYVAWAYSLAMDKEHRLGEVRNGRVPLGEMPSSLVQFRVLVSAEANGRVASRGGKLVMRATSPSALLLAHRDVMTPFLIGGSATMEHGDHAAHWPTPAADPRITPTPGMAGMRPAVAPLLPTASAAGSARPREIVRLASGDTLTLTAGIVAKNVAGKRFLMYGYNGQIPGPLISVQKNAQIVVRFVNGIDQPSTIHWHGVRLENRFDGTAHVTQEPVAPGDSFTYRVRFPDAGVYWYHPHVREDIQQDLGLYGNILVRAAPPTAHREEVLALDDLAVDSTGAQLPYGSDVPTHALMGRFGSLLLVNGEPSYTLGVRRGEIVRFYLTDVANARLFNLTVHGAQLKLVGSDMGNFERESWTTHVTIAPAERYIVDARFSEPGRHAIVNHVQWLDHARGIYKDVADTLGFVDVSDAPAPALAGPRFDELRRDESVYREMARLRRYVARAPDRTLTLGLKLRDVPPTMLAMLAGMSVPVDWNDGMPQMHWALTGREVTWTISDERGRENMAIDWRFKLGQVVKLRIKNRFDVAHAMAHPMHLHGQRFVVLARNGIPNENLGWKDTAVLPAGETMDLLVELTNPGRWMLHCHIAEHLGTGMMTVFQVER